MGLDQHIIMAHNKKEIMDTSFWSKCIDATEKEDFDYDCPAFLWYNRKNWSLQNKMQTDNGEVVQINKDELEEILNFLTHHPDYFDGFTTVPQICTIIYNYQKIKNNGFALFYVGDW